MYLKLVLTRRAVEEGYVSAIYLEYLNIKQK